MLEIGCASRCLSRLDLALLLLSKRMGVKKIQADEYCDNYYSNNHHDKNSGSSSMRGRFFMTWRHSQFL